MNAHAFTVFSFRIKKATSPATSGNQINNSGNVIQIFFGSISAYYKKN